MTPLQQDLQIRLDQYRAGTTSALDLTPKEAEEIIAELAELQRRREAMRCPRCLGTGVKNYASQGLPFTAACAYCHGTGDTLEPLPAPPADTVRVRTRDIGTLPPMDLEDEVEGSGR